MERPVVNSPYRYWRSGFAFEIAVFLGFIAIAALLSLLMWLIVG